MYTYTNTHTHTLNIQGDEKGPMIVPHLIVCVKNILYILKRALNILKGPTYR